MSAEDGQNIESGSGCQCLADFMMAQREIITRHLDEHKWLRHIEDRQQAVESFITDYGWLMREIWCTKVCPYKDVCDVAIELRKNGDLLKNHIKL